LFDGLSISDEVIDYIAENVTDNVRDLEGIIVSLMAHSIINNRDIDLNLARRVMEQNLKFERKRITVQKIQETVCDFFNIRKDLIQSASRKREIVQVSVRLRCILLKSIPNCLFHKLEHKLGGRNHATVVQCLQYG